MRNAGPIIAIAALAFIAAAGSADLADEFWTEVRYLPPDGVIPDEATAIRVAEALLGDAALDQRPLRAVLHGAEWRVRGTQAPGTTRGGVSNIRIDKNNGAVLGILHER